MATTLEELILRLEAQGAEQAAARVRGVAGAVRDLDVAGDAAAAGGMGNAAMSLGSLAIAAQGAIGIIGVVSGMLATLSGVRIAAQFQDLALSLETVTGSADKAARLLRELRKMGAETPFDTAELSQFAAQLIAAGTATEKVVGQLRTLADLAAYSRVPRAELPRFLTNLMQMRGQPTPQMEDIKEMVRLAPSIGKIVAAGTGSNAPMTSIEAMKKLQTMTGQQAFDTIVRGTEKIAKNAALMAATLSPINAFANMMENIQMIMEPTGQIILEVLKPIVAFASQIAQRLGELNAFTHGFAGLAVIIGIMARSWGLVRMSMTLARIKLDELRNSLNQLAASAGTATIVLNSQNSSNKVRQALSWGAVGAGIGNAGRGAMKFAKSPFGMAMGLELGGYGASLIPGQIGKYLSGILSGAGTGAMFGMMAGPKGALAGAGIGAILGGLQAWFGDHSESMGGADAAVRELQTTNQILKDIKGSLTGGGARAGAGIAAAEIEIAVARRFAMGYG